MPFQGATSLGYRNAESECLLVSGEFCRFGDQKGTATPSTPSFAEVVQALLSQSSTQSEELPIGFLGGEFTAGFRKRKLIKRYIAPRRATLTIELKDPASCIQIIDAQPLDESTLSTAELSYEMTVTATGHISFGLSASAPSLKYAPEANATGEKAKAISSKSVYKTTLTNKTVLTQCLNPKGRKAIWSFERSAGENLLQVTKVVWLIASRSECSAATNWKGTALLEADFAIVYDETVNIEQSGLTLSQKNLLKKVRFSDWRVYLTRKSRKKPASFDFELKCE